jgi:hypothetical protein
MDPGQTARMRRLVSMLVANPLCWFCREEAHFSDFDFYQNNAKYIQVGSCTVNGHEKAYLDYQK